MSKAGDRQKLQRRHGDAGEPGRPVRRDQRRIRARRHHRRGEPRAVPPQRAMKRRPSPADEGRLPDQEDAPGGEEQAVDVKDRLARRGPSREERPQEEAAGEPYCHGQQHRQGGHQVETVLDCAAGRSCLANLHADSPAETRVCAQCGVEPPRASTLGAIPPRAQPARFTRRGRGGAFAPNRDSARRKNAAAAACHSRRGAPLRFHCVTPRRTRRLRCVLRAIRNGVLRRVSMRTRLLDVVSVASRLVSGRGGLGRQHFTSRRSVLDDASGEDASRAERRRGQDSRLHLVVPATRCTSR